MAFHASAREFLLAVQERYRALQEYSDRGLVRRWPAPPRPAEHRRFMRTPGMPASAKYSFKDRLKFHRQHCKALAGRPESEMPFETACRRPDRFRFAWSRSHPHPPLAQLKTDCAVGCDAQGPYLYMRPYEEPGTVRRGMPLKLAVAGATGISQGAAHTIGVLLFEECGGTRLLDMRRPRFRGVREIDGVRCIAVTGLDRGNRRVTAWFGVEDLMLRRVWKKRMRSEELRFDVCVGGIDPEIRFEAPAVSG